MASDQEVGGLSTRLIFDRSTAYRLGISPSTIDQTLYDAYGQREVSTIYTQLNQYHVVLEVDPSYMKNPLDLRNLFIRTNQGRRYRVHGVGSGRLVQRPVIRTDKFADRGQHQSLEFYLVFFAFLFAPFASDNAFGGSADRFYDAISPTAVKCRSRPSRTWRRQTFPSP